MNNKTYPLAETNSGGSATEGVAKDYYEEIDGNNGKYKVMNLDHPKWAKSEGIIKIGPLSFSKGLPNVRTGIIPQRHPNAPSFSKLHDPITGYIVGVPTGRNEKGEIIWRTYKFRDEEVLNLSIPEERRRFIVFKYSYIYVDSPNFKQSFKCRYGLIDTEEQNERFFSERTVRVKAGSIAGALRGEDLTEAALLIGLDPNTMTRSDMQRKVIEFAESSEKDKVTGKTGSQAFLEMWESPNRVEWTTFKRAISTGVITHDMQNGTYNYQNLPIARSEEEVIAYFKRNSVQYTTIEMQSKKLSNSGTKQDDVAPMVNIRSQADAENTLLKEQLEALKKQNLELSKKVVNVETQDKLADENPRYTELLKEYSEKIGKGGHLIGRKHPVETRITMLEEKILEHDQSQKN